MRRALYAGTVAFAFTLIVSHLRSTPYNNYTLFASAVLHGRLWIDWPGPYIDAVLWHGHRYIVNDPLPGFLMLPLVAIFGTAANQTFLAAVLAGVGVGAAWELCARMQLEASRSVWLCAFYLLATDLLWCSMLGDVWFVAQTGAVAFATLALVELAGKNRGWVVMLWYVLSIASRFTMVMGIPAIMALIAMGGLSELPTWNLQRIRSAVSQSAAVLVPAFALWATYNYVRWGVPWDSGHTIFFHQDPIGSQYGSPFGLSHVPYQLWSFFVQYPEFSASFPWIRPSFSGVALTWTQPALIFVLFAHADKRILMTLWTAIALIAAPNLLYYVNGYAQYGMRHALDFMPFLLVLLIYGARRWWPLWERILIAYSCAAGLYGVWFWNAFIRTGN